MTQWGDHENGGERSLSDARPRRCRTDGGRVGDAPKGILPPAEETPVRLLGLSGAVVQRYHPDTLAAVVDVAAPDLVVATPPDVSTVVSLLSRDIDRPVLTPGRGVAPAVESASGGASVVSTTGTADSTTLREATDGRHSDEPVPRCVVSDGLSLSVDPYERTTAIEGLADYCERLPDAWHTPPTTHVVTTLRAGHATSVERPSDAAPLSLVGIGRTNARLGVGADERAPAPTVVSVYSNGAVDTEPVDPESVGLRGVRDIGPNRAEVLREHGYATPADLAGARLSGLAELDGFGRSTARSARASARATAEETVVPTGDGSLPTGDPVYVDIETDDLGASTVWLIGVLDGEADDGRYLAFRQQHPGDTDHLDGFATWLAGTAGSRPVVAWNGLSFDFPAIADHLRRHHPDRLDAWERAYTFDALYWARNEGNAALPGRTNALEHVAEALGWEPKTRGVDGSTVAEVYNAWRTAVERADDPGEVDPPDWARLEAYCEDDVRALATVYDGLRDAARRDPETTRSTGENSTQGALSDFG